VDASGPFLPTAAMFVMVVVGHWLGGSRHHVSTDAWYLFYEILSGHAFKILASNEVRQV